VQSVKIQPMFRRNILSPSSGSNKLSKIPACKRKSTKISDNAYRKHERGPEFPLARSWDKIKPLSSDTITVRTNRRQELNRNQQNRSFPGSLYTPLLVSYWFARWWCESPAVSFSPTASQWELRSTLLFPSCFPDV
jgi:hypothetical protein